MKRVCCYCKSIMDPGTGEPGEETSHGACPPCAAKAMAELVRGEIEELRGRLASLPSGRWPERRALEAMILRREVELHGLERPS
jgi:hypothetical protein